LQLSAQEVRKPLASKAPRHKEHKAIALQVRFATGTALTMFLGLPVYAFRKPAGEEIAQQSDKSATGHHAARSSK
jgi:hypothetical protein